MLYCIIRKYLISKHLLMLDKVKLAVFGFGGNFGVVSPDDNCGDVFEPLNGFLKINIYTLITYYLLFIYSTFNLLLSNFIK